jgi:hypothetical protein
MRIPTGGIVRDSSSVAEGTSPTAMESRVLVENGDKKLVIISEELASLAGPGLVENLKASSPGFSDASFRKTALESGLEVVLAVHEAVREEGSVVPIAHAFTTLSDGTLQATHVIANHATVARGADGCVDLAIHVLSTLSAGSGSLELAAGERKLGDRFAITLGADHLLVKQLGPDFEVYRVLAVRELGSPAPQLGIYVGDHPRFAPDSNAASVAGQLFGRPVEWQEARREGVIERQTLVALETTSLHLFLAATTVADAEAMIATAATLRELP